MITKKLPAGLALIIIITCFVYANSLGNSFVWDDSVVITDNGFVKSFSNLPALFSKNYLSQFVKRGCCFFVDPSSGSGETSYRPAVTASYFLDYFLWRNNASGWHFTNLLLHLANVSLLYFLIRLITANAVASLLASLLFALHPVNSEAVNVVAFREELLVVLFYLSSFIIYARLSKYRGAKKALLYVLSLVLFSLGLFSKEMSVTLPVVLVLYDRFSAFDKQPRRPAVKSLILYSGYFFVLAFYIWVRFFVMVNHTEPATAYPAGGFYPNLLTMSSVLSTYIRWIIFPVDIPAIMPNQAYLALRSLFEARALFSLVVLTFCFLAARRLCKFSKVSAFGLAWFFVTLIPVANIVPIPNYIAARYLYLPLAGFSLLFAGILSGHAGLKTSGSGPKLTPKAAAVIAVAALIIYAPVSFAKNTAWKNDTVFYSEMVRRYPENALAHFGLAGAFKSRGLWDKAIAEYQAAIMLNPGLVDARTNLGVVFGESGRYQQAIDVLKQAINTDPENLPAYDSLAVTYARMNEWDKARQAWEAALKINPEFGPAQDNLKKLKVLGH